MSKAIWQLGDTITGKGTRAKVIASNLLSDGQNWIKVQYKGQEYEGYQADFEAKGWKKPELTQGFLLRRIASFLSWFFSILFALMGLSLLSVSAVSGLLLLLMSAVLLPPVNKLIRDRFGLEPSRKTKAAILVVSFILAVVATPPPQETQGTSPSPTPSPVDTAVKPSPSPLPVDTAVKPSPKPLPEKSSVKPSPSPLPVQTVKQSPSSSPEKKAVKPSPSSSSEKKVVKPSPSSSPKKRAVQPSPSPSLKPQPVRASRPGNCECPYDTDRAGRMCGARSAYSRLGGRSGARCYTSDQ